ncbi:hypothetical protein [Paraburkholderia pallida]|uniref:Uncharacterized protein n=1 Tax=Paraburkholderia pallida TaxID=2547399 RepID=A0A4P7DA03_9BURK|nr:hypothetical protein [Paraburkholderia pallida]QBR04257.1 hypothetical protein E1956_44865 [Paraburkholderia pallida]
MLFELKLELLEMKLPLKRGIDPDQPGENLLIRFDRRRRRSPVRFRIVDGSAPGLAGNPRLCV